MKKNKNPPDNTGKKYLTDLTPKMRRFIDEYCSKYGEIPASSCAIAAGYSRDTAHAKANELLDYKKYPQVRMEIDMRLAESRDVWKIDRDKSMAHLFKIGQEARAKGNLGVAAKCEELRGKLAGLYIERNLTLTKELSKEDVEEKMKQIFPDKESFLQGQQDLMTDLFPENKDEKD